MCTIVAIKGGPGAPLVVAANRDEFYARPTAPPRRLAEAPAVVAGLDLEKGGTWMGANERGLFVALTNQRQHDGADGGLASRGMLVREALGLDEVEAIDDLLSVVDAREYNGFNLMYGDATALRVAYARRDERAVAIEALGDGVWVLPNDRIGSPDFPKTRRAHALVDPHAEARWPAIVDHLHAALADHQRPPLDAVPPPPASSVFTRELLQSIQQICVHTPLYGTRSSTVLALAPGRVEHYLHADGPPCEAAFLEVTELLR